MAFLNRARWPSLLSQAGKAKVPTKSGKNPENSKNREIEVEGGMTKKKKKNLKHFSKKNISVCL